MPWRWFPALVSNHVVDLLKRVPEIVARLDDISAAVATK